MLILHINYLQFLQQTTLNNVLVCCFIPKKFLIRSFNKTIEPLKMLHPPF